MKHLKKKLVAAVAMLVISAVALTGASFAWYTLSTNPEVANIKANVASNENLEIALNNAYTKEADVDTASQTDSTTKAQGSKTGNPYTWGNLVDLTTAMTTINPSSGSSTAPKLQLVPVKQNASSAAGVLTYVKYGTDGRVDTTNNALTAVAVSDYSDVTSTTTGVVAYKQSTSSTTYDALSVEYFLRSNETCNVSLSAATTRAGSADNQTETSGVNDVEGKGSYIELKITDENTTAVLDEYAKTIIVRFDVFSDTGTYEKTLYAKQLVADSDQTKATTNFRRYSLSFVNADFSTADTNSVIALTQDTAKKVKMWLFIDGDKVTNKSSLLDDSEINLNIQFSSDEIDKTTGGAMNGTTKTTQPAS